MKTTALTQQLRLCATKPGKVSTWIAKLDDEQLLFIFSALRNKESARNIARQIEKRWKINAASTVHSLGQGIVKFQKRIAHFLVFPLDEEPAILSHASFSSDQPLEALENIAELTRERIRKIITEEAETGARYPYLSRDLQGLAALQKAILKQKQWAMAHGSKDPSVLRNTALRNRNLKEGFDKFLSRLPNEGTRVVEVAEHFIKRINEESFSLEWDEEKGKYIAHEPGQSGD